MSAQIFFSHSSSDVAIARALKRELANAGVTAFMAPDDMRGTTPWPEQLESAIEESRMAILLLSPAANASSHVAREISIAVGNSRPVLLLRTEALLPQGSLRYLLQLNQWLDLFPGDVEANLERAVDEARSLLGHVPGAEPASRDVAPMAPLGSARPERRTRRTVTAIVCAARCATESGAAVDPEMSQSLMDRYTDRLREIVARHGGTTEPLLGDSVVAVFGLPTVHEDDALRAVRAALEIRAAVEQLNGGLRLQGGLRMELQIGMNTDVVVTGDTAHGTSTLRGEATGSATRLQQLAADGEILLGQSTAQLVRKTARLESAVPIDSGGARLASAWRLLSLAKDGASPGSGEPPLVGRERELAALREAFDRALALRTCQLCTLVAPAGTGKSRLVAALVEALAPTATMLRGRCLSYGQGITYWPIREVVHAAAGIDDTDDGSAARDKIARLAGGMRDADTAAARIASVLGLSAEPAPPEEASWAVRKLLEHIARERPLLLVVEDLHWAEEALLDLLEQLADLSVGAAITIIATARGELMDGRPAWAGGRSNATIIRLDALTRSESRDVVRAQPGGSALPDSLVERIAEGAEGNPLFIEEMVAVLREDGTLEPDETGTWSVASDVANVRLPPTINALLAARIDGLPEDDRIVAECAAVIGRIFERDAVAELAPETARAGLNGRLLGLVRRELFRPERSDLSASDAYTFRHVLLRDAAYDRLPKVQRAAMHERFADWLERLAGDRLPEIESIVAYHLEQAHAYRIELGDSGDTAQRLAARAVGHYVQAAHLAFERLDFVTATPLLEHAAALAPVGSPAWLDVNVELGESYDYIGESDKARELLVRSAEIVQPEQRALDARIRLGILGIDRSSTRAWAEEAERAAGAVIEVLSGTGEEETLALGYQMLAAALGDLGRQDEMLDACRLGMIHAVASGNATTRRAMAGHLLLVAGTVLPPEGARRLISESVDEADMVGGARAVWLSTMGDFAFFDGDNASGMRHYDNAIALADEFGMSVTSMDLRLRRGIRLLYAGEAELAEEVLRDSVAYIEKYGGHFMLSYARSQLAVALLERGRLEEAEQIVDALASTTGQDDLVDAYVEMVRSRLMAIHGSVDEGRARLRRVIETLPTQVVRAQARFRAQEIRLFRQANLHDEARAAAEDLRTLLEGFPAPDLSAMLDRALAS